MRIGPARPAHRQRRRIGPRRCIGVLRRIGCMPVTEIPMPAADVTARRICKRHRQRRLTALRIDSKVGHRRRHAGREREVIPRGEAHDYRGDRCIGDRRTVRRPHVDIYENATERILDRSLGSSFSDLRHVPAQRNRAACSPLEGQRQGLSGTIRTLADIDEQAAIVGESYIVASRWGQWRLHDLVEGSIHASGSSRIDAEG